MPPPMGDAPGAGGRPSGSIVALVENSRREVGLATCGLDAAPTISLAQVSDDKFYTRSLSLLGRFDARVLLFCHGSAARGDKDPSGGLLRAIARLDDGPLHVEPLSRKYFDEAKGLEIVRDVALRDDAVAVEKEVAPMFLALAAVSALVEYCRWKLNVLVQASRSIRIDIVQVDGYMLLDSATLANLEVLSNPRTGDDKRCLLGVLNRCRTRGGQRLLRTSLRMPLCDLPSIRARQQCVRALLSCQRLFEDTARVLARFGDFDAILRALVTPPASGAASGASPVAAAQSRCVARVRALLKLRHALGLAAELHAALEPAEGEPQAESAILASCAEQLRRPSISALVELIERVVRPEASAGKASSGPAALVSVVRDCVDPVLDHTRRVWEQGYADLHALVEHYNEHFGRPAFALAHSARRGFHLTAAVDVEPELPRTFIHVARASKRTLGCSTEQLEQINARMTKTNHEILLLTDRVLEGVLAEVRADVRLLYLLAESVSLLDMLLALAELAATADGEYTCPEITDGGPLVVRNGRHVLIEHLRAVDELVPNSLYLSEASNLLVLTGANMSGKSTMLQQSMLLVILAQVGAMVPAAFASVPVFGRLLSRLGSADCLESNASTFTVEMVEVAYIARALGAHDQPPPRALVVVDELGRGTSNAEGLAIAWATAELLAGCGRAYTLFATHFLQLDCLAQLYPNVRCYNMAVAQVSARDARSRRGACS